MSKTILMTGATSGLGREAALNLAGNGHKLWFISRSQDGAQSLEESFRRRYPKSHGSLHPVIGDLAYLKSVIKACETFLNSGDTLDVLIHNAGIWNFGFKESNDGVEETWQVNVLAPVLITKMVFAVLKKSNSPQIIFTASGLHQGKINFDDPEFRENFSGYKAYRQSKLADMLLTRYWAKQFGERGIGVYCQHPGLVSTQLSRDAGWFVKGFFSLFGRSPEKGAESLIYLAQSTNDELHSGAFYKDCTVRKTTDYSYDLEVAKKLEQRIEKDLQKLLPERQSELQNISYF